MAGRSTAHQFDKVLVVCAIREHDLSSVAAVENVMGVSGRNQSPRSWHWLLSAQRSKSATRMPLGTVPDLRGKAGQSPICLRGGDSPVPRDAESCKDAAGESETCAPRPTEQGRRSSDLEVLRYRFWPVSLEAGPLFRFIHRHE
jgi:hypothetical protein